MSIGVSVSLENAVELIRGFNNAKKLTTQWQRSALARGGRRVVRQFKSKWLSGPPGISGGQFKRGKHAFSFVQFGVRRDVVGVGISRILRVHEEGATIVPRQAKALYISAKTGTKGGGEISAVVSRVTIPARTGFRMVVRELAPGIAQQVGEANARAIVESVKRELGASGMKTFSRARI